MLPANDPSPATTVVVGPGHHGVVRHASTIARLTNTPLVGITSPASPFDDPRSPVVHLHYTDQLFGARTEAAASNYARLCGRLAQRVAVTLHDVPAGTTSPRDVRRAATYRRVAACADAVIVSSAHEKVRVQALGVGTEVAVIPLPIEPIVDVPPCFDVGPGTKAVGVLGFIYPGKGHLEVLEALARLPWEASLWALGTVAEGHDDLLGDLERAAVRRRRRFVVTGLLDEPTLNGALRRMDVPVVAAGAPSASASLASWIAAGRRPIVTASAYAREIAADAPELLTLVPPGDIATLARRIDTALGDPGSTWRSAPIPQPFSAAAVGARHLDLYRTLADG